MSEQAEKIGGCVEFKCDTQDLDLMSKIDMTGAVPKVDGVEIHHVLAERIHGGKVDAEVAFANGNPFDFSRANIILTPRQKEPEPVAAGDKFSPTWKGYDRRLTSDGSYRYYVRFYAKNLNRTFGSYKTEEHAAVAYDLARRQFIGKKAVVNFPRSKYLHEYRDETLQSWMEKHSNYYGNIDKKTNIEKRSLSVDRKRASDILPFRGHNQAKLGVPMESTAASACVRHNISSQDMAADLGISYGCLKKFIKEGYLPAPLPNQCGLDYYDRDGQRACLECKATGRGVNGLPFVPRPPRRKRT